MLRLVAYAPDGVRRFPVHRRELILGSLPECDICLPYTGVAQRHARLRYEGDELTIEDLGSRRGVLVDGKKVREAPLELLDEIRLGGVTLLVEDVTPPEDHDEEPAPPPAPPGPPTITPERMIEHVTHVAEWVLADVESRTTSESLVEEMLKDFGGGVLLLLQGELGQLDRAAIKLVVATNPAWFAAGDELVEQVRGAAEGAGREIALQGRLAGDPAWVAGLSFRGVDRSYTLIVALPRFSAEKWSPASALRTVGYLLVLGLVHHVGSFEPILPGQRDQRDLVLDPGLALGPSEAMSRVLEQLRGAVEPSLHVLLRGEPGVGKQRLARSLHLSSTRRRGPFITATCAGARPMQVEADLFGAEVPGKEAPVQREGKLLLAEGGTLFLDDVDRLPLELQDRLARFLRTGEVEPAGSRSARKVDVRLVAASRSPLEPLAARDLFRVDLAYRLSQFAIDVPALRERQEDLPLLIQGAVNRFCHEAGKRIRGITVKAMSALLSYPYPGNLDELDNVIRQLVYRSRPGQPIEVADLPEDVRLSVLRTDSQVDATSDLDLDRLVSATEISAIREALRRSQGNKSQAARALGLSRNGLAMKIERYGLRG